MDITISCRNLTEFFLHLLQAKKEGEKKERRKYFFTRPDPNVILSAFCLSFPFFYSEEESAVSAFKVLISFSLSRPILFSPRFKFIHFPHSNCGRKPMSFSRNLDVLKLLLLCNDLKFFCSDRESQDTAEKRF